MPPAERSIHSDSHKMLLEREEELAGLGTAAREARSGDGSIVLIEGEAGIGKSSVVNAIRSVLPAEGRLLIGYCDDLATPRVLGPLRDLRGSVGKTLADALGAGDRGQVAEALRAELDWSGHSTVMVVEDVHWADEATLDVLRFLVRHVAQLPVVLVLTFRDELGPDHPLRHLLGVVSRAPRVRRLRLGRLSLDAVRRLGEGTGFDPGHVYAMTSGNPFLVAEVIASGDVHRVPPSIAEAAGARLSGLDGPSRDAVERLSVIPSASERWLVEAVVPGGLSALVAAERHGVLSVSPTRVAFRHELTRRAVADSLPGARRVACNQVVLAALLARHAERAVDLSRLLHHAAEVGDDEAIIQYGPLAQLEAATAGSHREAVAHGRLVLARHAAFTPGDLVEILERQAVECLAVGLADEATAAQQEVVALRRTLPDARALGLSLRWLSRAVWWSGDRPRAEKAAAEAMEVLSDVGDEAALGWALSNQAQLLALAGRAAEAIQAAERAAAIARSVADAGLLSHALTNICIAMTARGDAEALPIVKESLQVSLEAGEVEHACRAYVNLAWGLYYRRRLGEAESVLAEAIEYAERTDFFGYREYLCATRSMLYLARAAWDDAEREAEQGINASPINRCPSLVVTGLARVRRGAPGGEQYLDEGLRLAEQLAEAQRLGPAAAAVLEAAWLRGEPASVVDRVLPWYDMVRECGFRPVAAEVGYRLHLAGCDVGAVDGDDPYALLARGDWQGAAAVWAEAGSPYEQALALSSSPEPDDVLAALSILDGIGASPMAAIVRSRLRALGVARIPRGPAASSRGNPGGLTGRQVEVLRLLAEGLTNAEIATRLTLSVRTVDTHVAAILDKLETPTRREAARLAADLGLFERNRGRPS